MSEFSSLGSRLAFARNAAGLRQSDVARALGLNHGIQVSKWENDQHAPAARTLDRLADLYGVAVSWLLNGYDYPLDSTSAFRGTVREGAATAYPLSRSISHLVRDFERELIRAGASDLEVDYALAVLRSPETSRLLHGAESQSGADAEKEARILMDALTGWVNARMALRQNSSPTPIKPADLPAEIEKRRAELEAEKTAANKPTRRTK